jgi:hypothetical protein
MCAGVSCTMIDHVVGNKQLAVRIHQDIIERALDAQRALARGPQPPLVSVIDPSVPSSFTPCPIQEWQ